MLNRKQREAAMQKLREQIEERQGQADALAEKIRELMGSEDAKTDEGFKEITTQQNESMRVTAELDSMKDDLHKLEMQELAESKGSAAAVVNPNYAIGMYLEDPTEENAANLPGFVRASTREDVKAFGGKGASNGFVMYARSPEQIAAPSGGLPAQASSEIIHALKAFGGVQRLVRIVETDTGNDIRYTNWDDTGTSAALQWLAAETDANDATAPTQAVVTLGAHRASTGLLKVDRSYINDSPANIGMEVQNVVRKRVARGTASTIISGNGTSQPTGIKGLAKNGVTLAAGATTFTLANLRTLRDSVDVGYWGGEDNLVIQQPFNASGSVGWVFSQSAWSVIEGLLESAGNDLNQTVFRREGLPVAFMGFPVVIDGNLDSIASGAAGRVPAMFGNFDYYALRMVSGILVEQYTDSETAKSDTTAFIARTRVDGKYVGKTSTEGTGNNQRTVADAIARMVTV